MVLTAHSATKASFHVIYKLYVLDGKEVMMRNKKAIKNLCKSLRLDSLRDTMGEAVIDHSVYKDGTLRTYLSVKSNKDNRPLIFAPYSQHISELEGFIGYCADNIPALYGRDEIANLDDVNRVEQSTTLTTELDEAIRGFVHREFSVPLEKMGKTDKFGAKEPFCLYRGLQGQPV